MKNSYYLRRIAIIAIVICTLLVNIYTLFDIIAFPWKLAPDVTMHIKRFEALRQELPSRGIAGYISDDTADDYASEIRIYLAQYSLAPVILVRSLDQQLVVGNFRNSSPDLEIYNRMGLIPQKNYGSGVVLFKREF